VHASDPESDDVAPPTQEPRQTEPKAASSLDTDVKPRKSNEVILYTTSWCPYCKKAKEFFKSRNIYFTEYDIEKDRDAAERKKRLDSKSGVPFAIVNGQQIHGYSPSAYERALQ
jgi:glutaredoxin